MVRKQIVAANKREWVISAVRVGGPTRRSLSSMPCPRPLHWNSTGDSAADFSGIESGEGIRNALHERPDVAAMPDFEIGPANIGELMPAQLHQGGRHLGPNGAMAHADTATLVVLRHEDKRDPAIICQGQETMLGMFEPDMKGRVDHMKIIFAFTGLPPPGQKGRSTFGKQRYLDRAMLEDPSITIMLTAWQLIDQHRYAVAIEHKAGAGSGEGSERGAATNREDSDIIIVTHDSTPKEPRLKQMRSCNRGVEVDLEAVV